MQAGKLRHRIAIWQPTITAPNKYGDREHGWSASPTTVWGSLEAVTGREAEYARTFSPTVSHKIRIRYRAGVLQTFKATYAGRTFFFDSVVDLDGRRNELSIYCTEQPNVATQVV